MGQYWEAFSWVDCFINKLKWRKTCQNVISFLEMLKWDDCALYVLSASNTTNDFSLLKNPMNWSDQWSTMKCEAVLCVRLKEGEGFPDVQSCHEDQSLKRPPRPDVFLYQPLYICILVHTKTWSLLAQTCALIFKPSHPSSPQKKDIVTSRLLHNNHFPNDRFPNNNHIRPIPCLFNWLTCLQNANESKS